MCVWNFTAETAIGALLSANLPAWKSAVFICIDYFKITSTNMQSLRKRVMCKRCEGHMKKRTANICFHFRNYRIKSLTRPVIGGLISDNVVFTMSTCKNGSVSMTDSFMADIFWMWKSTCRINTHLLYGDAQKLLGYLPHGVITSNDLPVWTWTVRKQ